MGFLAPVFGAIGSFIGGLGIVGKAIIGIGLNFVAAKIQQRNAKKNQQGVSGTQFDREYGENVSRKVACGIVGVSGHDVYVNSYATSNKSLEQLYVFSDFPCDGPSKIWAGGTLLTTSQTAADAFSVTLTVTSPAEYAGRMSFKFYYGTHDVADATLIANANPSGRWTAAHVGVGQCYMIARLEYDQEKLSQFPDFFFEIRGARLYILRKDSSVGGSGACRWGDYSTYEFTENPVDMDYNYRRGFTWGADALGRPDMFCGMGMDASDLPFDRYVTAANLCDEIVGGEKRYRCSIMLDCNVDHGDNIEALMTSCAGMVVDSVEGSWPLIGTHQPIVFTFTDDDLVVGEPVRFKKKRSMAELVNSVGGTYPEPSNMWSPAGYDTQTNAAQVGLDRRTRDMAINFETVPSKRQANQLASIYYNENRFEASGDVVLRPYFQDVKVGDWGQWISARYGTITVAVTDRSIRALTSDGPRNVALSLQERDGSIYTSVGLVAPPVPIPNGEPVYLNELQDWAVIPVLSVAQDGRTYPAFRMSWTATDDVTVDGVVFRWWLKSQPADKFQRQATARETLLFIQEGVINLQDYVFEHILIAPTRVTNWSSTREAKSLDGGNGDLEVGLGNLKGDVLDVFAQLRGDLNDVRPLLDRILTNFQHEAVSSEIARRKLEVTVGNSSAFFEEQIAVVANDLEAAAEMLTTLSASVGDISAQGMVKIAVVASPEGVDARASVFLRGDINDEFKEVGMYLQLVTEAGVQRSEIAFLADRCVFTDGEETTQAIVFEDGEAILALANIGHARAGKIDFGEGKVLIDQHGITVSS